MIWNIRLGNDSTAIDPNNPLEFEINADKEQYLVLLYPTDVISPNALLYDVARHNFTSFVVKDFELEQMNFGQLGLLLIKGFENLNEIKHYRKVMAASTTLTLPAEVRPVIISAQNFDTLLKNGRSFDEYFRYMRDKTYRDTEEAVLPPELFGESEGLTDEEAADETPLPVNDSDPIAEPEITEPQPQTTVEPLINDTEKEKEPTTTPTEETPKAPAEPITSEPDTPKQEPEKAPEQEPQPSEGNPVQEPAKTPTKEPAKNPNQKPVPKPTPKTKPTPKPVPKPQPKPSTKPNLPDYPDGSEGDDPLLD